MISDDIISNFMSNLYEHVTKKINQMKWPSGKFVDISSLCLHSLTDLLIPKTLNQQIEYEHRIWRKIFFPDLTYTIPRVQATTVDILINGFRVQDKSCSAVYSYYRVTLQKSYGTNHQGKVIKGPYDENDFDILWIFPHHTKYFWLIPMHVLVQKKYINNSGQPGKNILLCYINERKSFRNIHLWTRDYCYNSESYKIQERIQDVFINLRLMN